VVERAIGPVCQDFGKADYGPVRLRKATESGRALVSSASEAAVIGPDQRP
jgi:hypothetical protein